MATATKSRGAPSTELSVIDPAGYLALAPDSAGEIAEAIESVEGVGETIRPSDLIRVKTPSGGGTKWAVPDGVGGENYEGEIAGILVYVQKRGVLWPSFEPAANAMPVLVSDDLVTARQVGPIPDDMIDTLNRFKNPDGTFQWDKLPYNEFGSGKNGIGKRCKEQRMMFILREGDIYPMLVTAQPGSLRNVRTFFVNLPQAAKVPYWRCVVGLSLEKVPSKTGQDYARIVPRLVGTLTAEQGAIIKSKFTDVLAGVAKQVSAENTAETE